MELKDFTTEKLLTIVLDIIERGNEAVIRKRSKNGVEYIEIAEQKFKVAEKCALQEK